MKGLGFYVCNSDEYLDFFLNFVLNYSLLVKRTSRPDGYRPDCKCCCENLYITVQEVTIILSLALRIILQPPRSIVKYQLSGGDGLQWKDSYNCGLSLASSIV